MESTSFNNQEMQQWGVPSIENLFRDYPQLRMHEADIRTRYGVFEKTKMAIEREEGLDRFTHGYKDFGVMMMEDWESGDAWSGFPMPGPSILKENSITGISFHIVKSGLASGNSLFQQIEMGRARLDIAVNLRSLLKQRTTKQLNEYLHGQSMSFNVTIIRDSSGSSGILHLPKDFR
uniref:Uncharacterized protein n=1 Tax=Ciona savignyi TaxID=51511 RepID=H2YVI4_CIOSA